MSLDDSWDLSRVINEVNLVFQTQERVRRQPTLFERNLVLLGQQGYLDSLTIVKFLLDLESMFKTKFNFQLNILSEAAFSLPHMPYRTGESLAQYILSLIQESKARGKM